VVDTPKPGTIAWFAVRARTDVLAVTPTTNAEQIEQLQQEIIRLKGIVAGLARRANRELIAERLDTEDVIVYANDRAHVHEADMIRLKDGELLCVMREASEHISADGQIISVRSVDGGRNWGARQVVLDDADTDWRSASLCQLRDGTLLNNALPQVHYDGSGRFVGGHEPVPGNRGRTEGIYVGRSDDGGRTWSWPSEPMVSDPYPSPFTAERIVELDTGRLVMACYVSAPDRSRSISILYASEDGGHNWRYLAVIADVPGVSLNEPSLLQTRSGRLISVLRSNRSDGFYQAVSDDRGQTWSPAVPCGIPGEGNPASLVQLPDDTILCVHGSRIDVVGMYVVASRDDGDSWDVANRKVIRDDLANWDMSYPSTTVMPDGQVFTVYYFNMFHRFFMAGSFFRWEP
jgi:sialidase-1